MSDALTPPCGPLDDPTDPLVVASLTGPERVRRIEHLIEQAHRIADEAVDRWLNVTVTRDGIERPRPRTLVATCVLFSGGNDSTTLAHLFRQRATHAVHANTGIGIEATRQYVRDTCATWELPLVERRAPRTEDSYRTMVLADGFPGPAKHWKAYTRLKERALDAARHDLGIARSQTRVALWLAGRRRAESERRGRVDARDAQVPLNEYDGSVIWASPLAHWTKLDLNTYREMYDDVPRNEVSDLLHMSGECLCGAFAKPGELDRIAQWYPEVAAELRALEVEVRAAGHPPELCTWGHGHNGQALAAHRAGRLCSSCTVPDAEVATVTTRTTPAPPTPEQGD